MYDARNGGENRLEVRRRPARSRLFHNGRPVVAVPQEQEEDGASPVPRRAAS